MRLASTCACPYGECHGKDPERCRIVMNREAKKLQRTVWFTTHVPHAIRHTILRPAYWVGLAVGTTVSFPFEHWLWEHVWPFVLITRWLGL